MMQIQSVVDHKKVVMLTKVKPLSPKTFNQSLGKDESYSILDSQSKTPHSPTRNRKPSIPRSIRNLKARRESLNQVKESLNQDL
jgi:hypothetical protein